MTKVGHSWCGAASSPDWGAPGSVSRCCCGLWQQLEASWRPRTPRSRLCVAELVRWARHGRPGRVFGPDWAAPPSAAPAAAQRGQRPSSGIALVGHHQSTAVEAGRSQGATRAAARRQEGALRRTGHPIRAAVWCRGGVPAQFAPMAACWYGGWSRRTGPAAAGPFQSTDDHPMPRWPGSFRPPMGADRSGQQGSSRGCGGAKGDPPTPAAAMGLGLGCGGAGRAPPGVARGTGWESSPAGVGSQPWMEKASAVDARSYNVCA